MILKALFERWGENSMILIVNKMYPPEIGGVEVVTKVVADTLSEKGHKVVVLTFNRENKFVEEKIGNVDVLRLPSIFVKNSIRISPVYGKIFRELVGTAEKVIFNFPSGFPELFAKLYEKIPVRKICFYHADVVRYGAVGWLYNKFLVQRFLRGMDVIIASSPNIVKTSKFLKRYEDKVKVIPLFVDVSHFYPRDPQIVREKLIPLFGKKPRKIVMYVGRLSKYKGLEYLINAMSFLDEKYGLVLIGEGPMKEKLLSVVRRSKLEDRVLFLKHVPYEELPYYYSAADVFVLPSISRAEAFGLVVLEAMACGTPVITTELGTGTSYHNVHGKTGLVVPPRDSKKIASAVEEICEGDWKNTHKLVITARVKDFSLERFKNSIMEVLER